MWFSVKPLIMLMLSSRMIRRELNVVFGTPLLSQPEIIYM